MSARVYFNSTFASYASLVKMLKKNPDGREVTVLGSHKHLDSPFIAACDHAQIEPFGNDDPVLDPDAYVNWLLEKCERDRVDVLVPTREQLAVARRAPDFRALGVRVLSPSAPTVELLEDKVAAYRHLAAAGIPVPPFVTVTSSAELLAGVQSLGHDGDLIIKPTQGRGATGVYLLTRGFSIEAILKDPRSVPTSWVGGLPQASVEAFAAAMDRAEASGRQVRELMLMPYLFSPEISTDTLAAPGGEVLTAISRSKRGRVRSLSAMEEMTEMVEQVHRLLGLDYLTNTQVRYLGEERRPVLLEINTRASGGLYQTEITGANMMYDAVKLALGEAVEPFELTAPVDLLVSETLVPVVNAD